MGLVKGFGKNYFTLRAITALVNQVFLDAIKARIHNYHTIKFIYSDVDINELLDAKLSLQILQKQKIKPCHCNCHFLRYTKKILLLNKSQNKHLNYFKTLNNSISPP